MCICRASASGSTGAGNGSMRSKYFSRGISSCGSIPCGAARPRCVPRRGVVGLVRFGGQPAVVPDAVMDALLQREDAASGLHQDNRPLFSAGEAIKLVDGPLAGVEGVFTQQDGDKRVIVLLELLGKANKVSVSRDWIARAA